MQLKVSRFPGFRMTPGRNPWMLDQPAMRPLLTHDNTKTQTSIFHVEFEPTTPLLEQRRTVHTLDCVAAVINLSASSLRPTLLVLYNSKMQYASVVTVVLVKSCHLANR